MRTFMTATAAMVLSGCMAHQPTKPVALSKVVSNLRQELAQIRAECDEHKERCTSGNYLSEVSVTLAVTEGSESSFSVDIPVGPAGIGFGSTQAQGSTNTVNLKFNSPLFVSKDALIRELCATPDGHLRESCVAEALKK
jgi:hypothetical protein